MVTHYPPSKPFPPQALRVAAGAGIIVTFIVFLVMATLGVLWAFQPSTTSPENPPVVHVFNSDLTIHSPTPNTTPTSVGDWLNQIAHAVPAPSA